MNQLPVHIPSLEHKITDYEFVKFLGKGAYSEVVLAKSKITGHQSALKIIDKNFITKEKKAHHVLIEKQVLSILRHPGIIKLFSAFENEDKLYFSLELLNDGNLFEHINCIVLNKDLETQLTDKQIQFYTAELLTILEYIHQNGLIHRDVKPENILLTKDKHLKLIDFATILVFDETKTKIGQELIDLKLKHRRPRGPSFDDIERPNYKFCRESSFVGTSEFLCPELVDLSILGPQADLWALGCFIYQLYTNTTPFQNDNEFWLFHNISTCNWKQNDLIPPVALDLIKILLNKNPDERFNGLIDGLDYNYDSLKKHAFFKDIDFKNMWLQDVPKAEDQKQIIRRRQSRFISTMVGNPEPIEPFREKRGSSNSKYKADQVIMKGIVDKEHGILFFSQFSPRSMSLIIQNGIPYLVYINPQLNNKKTTIQLNQCTSCRMLEEGKFILGDKNKKKYIFREKDQSAEEWVTNINKLIQTFLL